MALRNPALALFCAVVLLACGGGPVKRISPPTASVQQLALQAIGVRRMQGWLFAKAMDQASLCALL